MNAADLITNRAQNVADPITNIAHIVRAISFVIQVTRNWRGQGTTSAKWEKLKGKTMYNQTVETVHRPATISCKTRVLPSLMPNTGAIVGIITEASIEP